MAVKTLGLKAVTAGTAVAVSATRIPCQAFVVQADPDNDAIGACGISTLVYSTRVGVIGFIGVPSATGTIIPAFSSHDSLAPGPFNLADLYLDCDSGTQNFIVSYVE